MKDPSRLFLSILSVMSLAFSSNAQDNPGKNQTEKLKIDLDKKTISSPLAFDEYIDLEISSKNNKLVVDDPAELIRFAFVDEIKAPYSARKFLKTQEKLSKRKKKHPTSTKFNKLTKRLAVEQKKFEDEIINFEVEKINDSVYKATLPPQVLPSSMYELVFRKRLNDSQMSIFYEILHLISKQSIQEASQLYSEKLKKLEKEKNRKVPLKNFPRFSYLNDIYPELKGVLASFQDVQNTTPNLIPVEIQNISEKYVAKGIATKNLTAVSFEYLHKVNGGIDDILKGIRTFSDNSVAENYDYQARFNNLKASVKQIEKVVKEIQNLMVLYANDLLVANFYSQKILILKTNLETNKEALKKITDSVKNLEIEFIDQKTGVKILRKIENIFSFGEIITNKSISLQDKESGLTYLESDVGIINTLAPNQLGNQEYIGRLYLGLNYHIGGYNKNKRIREVTNKRLSYNFSIAIGVTVGEINEGGYTDLFNKISPSFGINYRLAQDVRIGFGGLILRRDRNPIITNENPTLLPYISTSFNLKVLKDLAIFDRIFNSQK